MRFNRTSVAFVVTLLAAAIPALAADPAPAAAPEVAPEAAPAQPAEFPWLTPEPMQKAGQIAIGPCSISISCRYGSPIGCSGQNECQWRYDLSSRGYVECDHVRTWCPLATDP